jgi:hypothetical protein
MLRWSALPVVLALTALPALADEDAAVVYIRPVPAPVAAVTRCDETGPATTSRRIFSGFIVFTVECPVVRLNFRYEIVAADAVSGEGARLLTFPKPHPANPDDPEDVLYNTDPSRQWRDRGAVRRSRGEGRRLPPRCALAAHRRRADGQAGVVA